MNALIGFSLLIALSGLAQAEMRALSTDELGNVTGREGIAFEWDLRINADENGAPLASLPLTERRLALQLANRPDEWIVFKGFTGRINFPTFYLDAYVLPVGPTVHADVARFGLDNPYGRPAMIMSFPEAIEFYDFTIGAVSVEYGATGYLNDPTDSRSFLGLQIGNSIPGQPGLITAEGQATIYGF